MDEDPLPDYLYVSKEKLAVLPPPRSWWRRILQALNIKLAVGGSGVSVGVEAGRTTAEQRQQIRTIERYLRDSGKVGTLDSPAEWIADTLTLRWAIVGDGVLFCGVRGRRAIALGGAAHHVMGGPGRRPEARGLSAPPALIEFLVSQAHAGRGRRADACSLALELAQEWDRLEPGVAVQQARFLARYHGEGQVFSPVTRKTFRVFLASPLYVANAARPLD
jgi:hypothetical protein